MHKFIGNKKISQNLVRIFKHLDLPPKRLLILQQALGTWEMSNVDDALNLTATPLESMERIALNNFMEQLHVDLEKEFADFSKLTDLEKDIYIRNHQNQVNKELPNLNTQAVMLLNNYWDIAQDEIVQLEKLYIKRITTNYTVINSESSNLEKRIADQQNEFMEEEEEALLKKLEILDSIHAENIAKKVAQVREEKEIAVAKALKNLDAQQKLALEDLELEFQQKKADYEKSVHAFQTELEDQTETLEFLNEQHAQLQNKTDALRNWHDDYYQNATNKILEKHQELKNLSLKSTLRYVESYIKTQKDRQDKFQELSEQALELKLQLQKLDTELQEQLSLEDWFYKLPINKGKNPILPPPK
ncbi:MAG: hypothetical protein GY810_18050 [Aureispira sp.]|nr:hypothetical protein [Aureispira sp.]